MTPSPEISKISNNTFALQHKQRENTVRKHAAIDTTRDNNCGKQTEKQMQTTNSDYRETKHQKETTMNTDIQETTNSQQTNNGRKT